MARRPETFARLRDLEPRAARVTSLDEARTIAAELSRIRRGAAVGGALAVRSHALDVEWVGTHVRADGWHVVDSPLGQAGPQVGVGAVGGISHDHGRAYAPAGQGVEHVQSQPPLQRTGGGVTGGVDAGHDLAVGTFAQGSAVLRSHHPGPHPAVLGY